MAADITSTTSDQLPTETPLDHPQEHLKQPPECSMKIGDNCEVSSPPTPTDKSTRCRRKIEDNSKNSERRIHTSIDFGQGGRLRYCTLSYNSVQYMMKQLIFFLIFLYSLLFPFSRICRNTSFDKYLKARQKNCLLVFFFF